MVICPVCALSIKPDGHEWQRCLCGTDVNMNFTFHPEYFQKFYNVDDGGKYRDYLLSIDLRKTGKWGAFAKYDKQLVLREMILPFKNHGTVLEFGAGNFGMAMYNQICLKDVTVVDRTQYKIIPPGIRFINADACTFVPDKKYDFVIASFVLEHLQKPHDFIKVCADALADDGIITLSYAVNDCLETMLYGYDARYYRPDHVFMANRVATLGMLKKYFHIDHVLYQCSSIDLFGKYNRYLQRLVCNPIAAMKLSGRVIVWGRKLPGMAHL